MQNLVSQVPPIPILNLSILILVWILPLVFTRSREFLGQLWRPEQRSQKSVGSTTQFLLDSFFHGSLVNAASGRVSKGFWVGPWKDYGTHVFRVHLHYS